MLVGLIGASSGRKIPEVSLEVHSGKSQFYIGDLIQLDLAFRGSTTNAYSLNGTDYGDIADQVEITPAMRRERGWCVDA